MGAAWRVKGRDGLSRLLELHGMRPDAPRFFKGQAVGASRAAATTHQLAGEDSL